MKRVLTAVVLIPIVLLLVLRAPGWLFTAALGLVAILAAWEYLDIAEGYPGKVLRFPTLVLMVALFGFMTAASASGWDESTINVMWWSMTTLAPLLLLAIAMRREQMKEGLLAAATSYLTIPYIGFSLLSLVALRQMGWIFVPFVLLVVWVGDTAAYYVGRGFGKHLMAPRVSPKKTWEGAVASVIGSVIAAIVLFTFAGQLHDSLQAAGFLFPGALPVLLPIPVVAVVAIVVNIAAQLGDLAESLIKRGANVKDSGAILPGHGGMLDRIDALLFAAPAATVMLSLSSSYFRVLR